MTNLAERKMIGQVARIIHREVYGIWRNGDSMQAATQRSALTAARQVIRHLMRQNQSVDADLMSAQGAEGFRDMPIQSSMQS